MANKTRKEELRALIRECGLRVTSARVAVCEILSQAGTPLTHAEVAKALAARDIDQATVFRNLTDLVDAGLIRRMEVGDHLYRFEWRGDDQANTGHAHFVCVECGEVTCLTDLKPATPAALQRAGKNVIRDVTEVLYKGHCSSCD